MMYDTIPIKGLSREEWLRLRKNGIGGSDAGAICGLNPYVSAMEVFQDKTTEEVEDVDNESMRQGRDLEAYVAQRFMEETGLKARRSNVMYRSRENPFMIADVDRLVVGQDAGLECKTASAYSASKWKDGKIPPHYLIQCLHYMAVTGKREWYIAVVILGRDFQFQRINWDEGVIGKLMEVERAFWRNHVEAGVMPDPDGSKACDEMISRYFRTARVKSGVPLVGFDEKLDRRERLLEMIERLERERKMIEQEIKCFMGNHERAFSDRYSVTWGNVESVRLDTKRIKKERPELYRYFAITASSRKFTVKAA